MLNSPRVHQTIHECQYQALREKATIHQATTMLATSKNVLFPGHNHLLTTGTDDPTLWYCQRVKGHQYRWFSRWFWPGNRTFLEVTSMVVTQWIVAFFAQWGLSLRSPHTFLCVLRYLLRSDDYGRHFRYESRGMNPNWLYAGSGTWTQVAYVRGRDANHHISGAFSYAFVFRFLDIT